MALLAQDWQGGLGDQEGAAGVDAHDPLPGLEVDPLAPSVAEAHTNGWCTIATLPASLPRASSGALTPHARRVR